MDKASLSEESDKISIHFNKPIETSTVLDYLKQNANCPIVSGEFSLINNNKRMFLAGITFNDNINLKSLPLFSGRLFSRDDIINSSKVALVGYNLKDLIIRSSNEDFLEIEGQKYRVVGYIGRDTNSYWNGSVLVPMKAIPASLQKQKIPNIDYLFFNKNASKEEALRAKNYFNSDYSNSSILGSYKTTSLNEILYSKRTFLTSIALLIIISITNIINFTYNWCRKNRKQFSVLVLLGYKKKHLLLILSLSLLFIIVPAFIAAIFINLATEELLSQVLSISIKFKYENFCTGVIFSTALLTLCLVINYIYILRANLASELRR
ncbi:ABC transporter permease [Clostridium yunnanense]|nr:ABC transporter permease [Clostridium yunnanense]